MKTFVALLIGALATGATDSVGDKLTELRHRFENGSNAAKDFEFQEGEANSHLRGTVDPELPEAIESPWIRFQEGLAIIGATVDLDLARKDLPDSMVFRLLSGKVPVEVTARMWGDEGVGKLELEKVLLAGVELPLTLVEALTQGDSAAKLLPEGFRVGEAFALPYDIESIHLRTGAAVVRQRATASAR